MSGMAEVARENAVGFALVVVLTAGFGLAGCGDDDSSMRASTATPTFGLGGPEGTPTPTVGPCDASVVAQCATQCGGLGGCCAVPAPGSGAFACFDPSVHCALPCTNPPSGWIGGTPCGSAPGDQPEKACIVVATPTPTVTATVVSPCTPVGSAPASVTPGFVPGATPPTATNTIACDQGNIVTFANNNPYPVWLAEAYQGAGVLDDNIIVPPNGDWVIAAGTAVSLCLPTPWSGRFWARTECDFDQMFGHDPAYEACTSPSDCDSSAQTHVCYGGRCMLECTNGGTPFCQGSNGLDDSNAVCVESQFAGTVNFCSYPQGSVCKTGDCQGLYQCYGVWNGNAAEYGATGPVSLFEPTSTSADNVNYDVSLVSGYNTRIAVLPSSASCYAPACVSDLNESCPANLRVFQAPSATPGPVSCGADFCRSGVCVGGTCVIGCNDPGDQCSTATPPANLKCGDVVPAAEGGDGSSTYDQMYNAKGSTGDTMISGNQGTATCWGPLDCLPEEVCRTCLTGFPTGVGICLPANGDTPQPQIGCANQADVGKACGGYSNNFTDALGYTCAAIGARSGDVACVPAYDPPVSGSGTLTTGNDGTTMFYSGTGSPLNPAWLAAAKTAGGGTPWYEVFSQACPHQYGWQYDDHTGGFACMPTDGSNVNFTVTFGPPVP